MKKFENFGRILNKKNQKEIKGGPGGGSCCGTISCWGDPNNGNQLQGYVCGFSYEGEVAWVGICQFEGFGGTVYAVFDGCGCTAVGDCGA